jgi:hypothetical protein
MEPQLPLFEPSRTAPFGVGLLPVPKYLRRLMLKVSGGQLLPCAIACSLSRVGFDTERGVRGNDGVRFLGSTRPSITLRVKSAEFQSKIYMISMVPREHSLRPSPRP